MQKQVQEQILVGTSYSERFAEQYHIKMPTAIKKPTDAKFLPRTHDNYASDKAIAKAYEIISKFDELSDDIVDRYRKHWKNMKYFNVQEILGDFKKGHESTEQLIRVYESVLSYGDINPTTYIHAKRHFMIAKIFIEKFKDIDFEKIKYEDLKLEDDKKENFKLGVFVGLEPILVTTLFSSSNRDDPELSQVYGKLVDKYSHMVAQMYPQEYLESAQLDKPSYTVSAYAKFVDYLEEERHGQILL